jgi:uncharacterized tellurite resistance protein B-like protein
MVVMLLAGIDTADAIAIPLSASVNVPAEAAVLAITILLTTVVVADGTVYRVADDVAKAALASALVVVGICCSLS